MLKHPDVPGLFLLQPADARDDPDGWPAEASAALPAARIIFDWARDYLSRPHPDLGRPGPVCPYVPRSLRSADFWVTAHHGARPVLGELVQTILLYRDWFVRLEPRHGRGAQLKTILVLFPDVTTADAPLLVDRAQELLKTEFVRAGLMVGEFHPGPPSAPGLWNKAFRPLHSPVPLLAIRHMVPTDLPFLTGTPEHLAAYLARFGHAVPPSCRPMLDAAMATCAAVKVSAADVIEINRQSMRHERKDLSNG
jgi:hypothetical protein